MQEQNDAAGTSCFLPNCVEPKKHLRQFRQFPVQSGRGQAHAPTNKKFGNFNHKHQGA
jgi:hypothetical protein